MSQNNPPSLLKWIAILIFSTIALGLSATHGLVAEPIAERVVVVGVDGLSPAGVRDAQTPVLDGLCKRGSWSMHARAVMPTSSSPNWASMIMGAGPEQHGITSNEWERNKFEIEPIARGAEGIFPTIFSVIRQQKPAAVIGVFHDWDGFGRLVEKSSCDTVEDAAGPDDAARRAIAFIKTRQPTLTFVHLDHVDHAGHEKGWGSPEYLQAVTKADQLIGQIIDAVQEAGLTQSTLLIVTADHGGKGTKHGGFTMEEIEIPWIAAGPGIRPGTELSAAINTYDTAATIIRALGLKAPDCWIAKPVSAAFERPE